MKNRVFIPANSFDSMIRRALNECDEIVLFGSRSLKMARRGSDWDVLCVSESSPHVMQSGCRRARWRSGAFSLDVVWVRRSELNSATWLGSELAGHVAQYGTWLRGDGEWRTRAGISMQAINTKRRRVEIRTNFQMTYAAGLLEPYRRKHTTLLRRDIQRLNYLQNGLAVPVTPYLDREWSEDVDRETIYRFAHSFGCDLERWVSEQNYD